MGVNFRAKGLPYSEQYDCGYMTFGIYRKRLAVALQPVYGLAYWAWYGASWSDDEGFDGFVPVEIDGREITKEDLLKAGLGNIKHLNGVGPFEEKWSVSMDEEVFSYAIADNFTEAQINFLFAPDCEGRWSWQECREMYKEMKDVEVDMPGHNYGEVSGSFEKPAIRQYSMHEQFMNIMRHCWKRRVNLTWC